MTALPSAGFGLYLVFVVSVGADEADPIRKRVKGWVASTQELQH